MALNVAWLLVRRVGLSISESADLQGSLHTAISRCTENGQRSEENGRTGSDDSKATVTNNQGTRGTLKKTTLVS